MVALARRSAAALLLDLCVLFLEPAPAQSSTLGDALRTYGAAAGPIVACADDDELSKPIVLPDGFPEAPSREDLACALRLNGYRVAVLASGIAVLPAGAAGKEHPTWEHIDEIAAMEETVLALRAMPPAMASVALVGAWFHLAECPPAARLHLLAATRQQGALADSERFAKRTVVHLRVSAGVEVGHPPGYYAGRLFAFTPAWLLLGRWYRTRHTDSGALLCTDGETPPAALTDWSADARPPAIQRAAAEGRIEDRVASGEWSAARREVDGQPMTLGTLSSACTAAGGQPTACDPAVRDAPVLAAIGPGSPADALEAALVACEAEIHQADGGARIGPTGEAKVRALRDVVRRAFLAGVIVPGLEARGRAGEPDAMPVLRETLLLGEPYAVPHERMNEVSAFAASPDVMWMGNQQRVTTKKYAVDNMLSGDFGARVVPSATWYVGHIVVVAPSGEQVDDPISAARYMILKPAHTSVGWDAWRHAAMSP